MIIETQVRAGLPEEHKALCTLAREGGSYTRDFSNMMFSGDAAYQKGWIRVAEDIGDGHLYGLTCVRHKVRTPVTELYFIVVSTASRSLGIGTLLLDDLKLVSPHHCIGLNCMKENEGALRFYKRHGFTIVADALGGQAHRMQLEW